MNIKILRVRTAAALFKVSSERVSGGVIESERSLQTQDTPSDSSTSIRRFTSSIFGMSRRVVVPLFNREAAMSATAPFLEEFVVMVPLKGWPPSTTNVLRMLSAIETIV